MPSASGDSTYRFISYILKPYAIGHFLQGPDEGWYMCTGESAVSQITDQERMLRTDAVDEISMFLPCIVHKASSSQTWQLSAVNNDISAVVACSLFMSGAGSVATFRKHLLNVMKEKLVLVHSDPPGGRVKQYREEVYNLYLSDDLSRTET